MGSQETQDTINLVASDVTQQRKIKVNNVPNDYSLSEVVEWLRAEMSLSSVDSEGRPLAYQAVLTREGRKLNGNERVGDALKADDEVTLMPNIDAGLGHGG